MTVEWVVTVVAMSCIAFGLLIFTGLLLLLDGPKPSWEQRDCWYSGRRKGDCETCRNTRARRAERLASIPGALVGLTYPLRCLWSGTIGALAHADRVWLALERGR